MWLTGLPRLENTAGTGFDPNWAGTNATNIPEVAIVVDSTDTNIRFCNTSLWSAAYDTQYHGSSLLFTTKKGAWLTHTFEGVAIW
jgi:hypothetical protein